MTQQEQLQAIADFVNSPPDASTRVVTDLYKNVIQQRIVASAAVTKLQNELNTASASLNQLAAQEAALLVAVTKLKELARKPDEIPPEKNP